MKKADLLRAVLVSVAECTNADSFAFMHGYLNFDVRNGDADAIKITAAIQKRIDFLPGAK